MTDRKKAKSRKAKRTTKGRKSPNGPGRKNERGLSDGEKRFAREYLVDFNATQAALRAGYAPKSADVQGARLFGRDRVKVEIARLAETREKKLDISADRTLLELARIAFFDPREVVDWLTHQVGSVDLPNPDDPDDGEAVTVDLKHTQVTLKDAKAISADAAAAISEVSQTKDGALKIKFHSKPAALNILARHHGLIIDRAQVDLRVLVGNMPDDQLEEYRRQLMQRRGSETLRDHHSGRTNKALELEYAGELRPAAKTA